MKQNTPASPYLLLFRNSGSENYAHLSAEQRQQLITRWVGWYDNLAKQGKAIEGQPLEMEEVRIVSGPGGARVIDGPFAEAKEAVGGYVKLMVADIEEATELARQHPGLQYGLQIEVRQMAQVCHLGVTSSAKQAEAATA